MKHSSSVLSKAHRPRTRALCLFALALAATCGGLAWARPQTQVEGSRESAQRIESARAALDRWVETRKLIARERADWALGKELIGERIALLEREIAAVDAREGELKANLTEAEAKRAELLATDESQQAVARARAARVTALEARTRSLLARLPQPLRKRVEPLSQRLPTDPESTKLSTSERFQNVVGILNEAGKFQREISVVSEVRSIDGGLSAEVATMYVGLACAYFSGANGSVAGIGGAGPESWQWRSDAAAAAAISRAIAIQAGEQVAAFVALPIQVQ